jgi:replication factor C subunit 1
MANVRAAGWASGGPPPFVQFPTWLGKNSRRNKRARLLAELGLHMAAHTSGGRESVRLDYLTSMRARLFAPLVAASKTGGERVEPATAALRVAELLDEYGLSKVRGNGRQPGLPERMQAGVEKGRATSSGGRPAEFLCCSLLI